MLLDEDRAIVYSEPQKKVTSRSGVECVVALTDQWCITYGELEWKKLAEECLMNMNLYSEETRHNFEHTVSWLNPWACSRSFGLGTNIPWDEQFLVESLSDSTIYMAYYTIAHFLQNGNMYGFNAAANRIKPEHMTDAVWDFLFCGGQYPESSDIEASVLSQMKQEFEYWYPFDLRVSGKDLIHNHLTFSIYNHTAIMDRLHWPRGFRCNGHIMLNSEKMSKSTGNFWTLRQAVKDFSADATRFALADAGDGVDDANFVFGTAGKAILELTKEIAWMEQIIASEVALRPGTPSTLADRLFQNEVNVAIKLTEQHYQNYLFRAALISGFRDLQTARNDYRSSCGADGMNRDLIWRFMDVQTRLITPICPHYGEYVWRKLLKKEGFAVKAGWPVADVPDRTLQQVNNYLQHSMELMNKRLQKRIAGDSKKELMGLIYVSERYEGWKEECLKILSCKFDSQAGTFAPQSQIIATLQKSKIILSQVAGKQILKVCMPFIKYKMDEVLKLGPQALDLKLPFSEMEVLLEYKMFIKRQLGLKAVEIILFLDADVAAEAGPEMPVLRQNPPSPGNPCPIFVEIRRDDE